MEGVRSNPLMTYMKHKFKFTKKRKRFKYGGYAKEGRQAKRDMIKKIHLEEMVKVIHFLSID